FPATCAECGKETEVPFEPRTGRPVYCSDCYRKTRPSR
ncbi:MAG: zinc-binding protein, partial [Dehalococcoidia bacterium]|nr:zinc-binding protein [Dehalococcoidia bacterium]